MTRDDIIRMAREAGGLQFESDSMDFLIEGVYRFAALVAAAERERCAEIADSHASIEGIAQRIAAEIRGKT